jgi:hypothetical protein
MRAAKGYVPPPKPVVAKRDMKPTSVPGRSSSSDVERTLAALSKAKAKPVAKRAAPAPAPKFTGPMPELRPMPAMRVEVAREFKPEKYKPEPEPKAAGGAGAGGAGAGAMSKSLPPLTPKVPVTKPERKASGAADAMPTRPLPPGRTPPSGGSTPMPARTMAALKETLTARKALSATDPRLHDPIFVRSATKSELLPSE